MVGNTVARNVVNQQFSEDQLRNVAIELEQKEFQLGKREAKNVVDLNLYINEEGNEVEKRDAKDVFDAKLIIDESELLKRDARNVFDINFVVDDASLVKRDSKNVFNINLVVDEAEGLGKRDAEAKNVANIHLIIDDDSLLVKRGVENVVDISLNIPVADNHYLDALQNPLSLGYIIGKDHYTVDTYEKSDDRNMKIRLKHDSHGCHQKKKKLDLESLSEVLTTFKEKMFDPVIEAKDKFVVSDVVPDEDAENTVVAPAKGDLASALIQHPNLSLFAKYLRESPALYRKCENVGTLDTDASSKMQILLIAPTNSALTKLEKKPWQFPEDIGTAKSEDEQDMMVERNIANFVESHFIETKHFSVSDQPMTVDFLTLNNRIIVLENFGDHFRIKFKDTTEWIDVVDVEVLENGAILTIDSCLVY